MSVAVFSSNHQRLKKKKPRMGKIKTSWTV